MTSAPATDRQQRGLEQLLVARRHPVVEAQPERQDAGERDKHPVDRQLRRASGGARGGPPNEGVGASGGF